MYIRRLPRTPTLVLSVVLLVGNQSGAQAPPTIEQSLSSKGVAATISGLRKALEDLRPEVRVSASALLAQREDFQSIPLIESALHNASTPREKEGLALSLITLKDPRGFSAMREVCENTEVREDLRLTAAILLLDAHDHGCTSSVVQILSVTIDHSVRLGALNFLQKEPVLPLSLEARAELGLRRALQDDLAVIRKASSEYIGAFRVVGVKPYLETALQIEKDDDVRVQMKHDLQNFKVARQ